METAENASVEPVAQKLEVVLIAVSDVDRAKAFYQKLGWRLDIDIAAGDFCIDMHAGDRYSSS